MMNANEFESADEFNAFLDSLVHGGAPRSANVDPAVVEGASQFHRLGAIAKPEQRFVLRLEDKLMESSVSVAAQRMTAVPLTIPHANGNLRSPHDKAETALGSHRLKPILLAAVTAICIASAIAFGIYRMMPPGSPENDEIPAPVVAVQVSPESAAPDESGCTITARTEAQHALRGSPTVEAVLETTAFAPSPDRPDHHVPVVAADDLPDGQSADPEVVSAVEGVVRELVACLNTGDFARVDALYSDDSFRRAYGGLDQEHEPSDATPEVEAPDEPRSVPEILDVRVLDDGRVGVLLAQDVSGYGLPEYLILVSQDGRWLIDEQAMVLILVDAAAPPPDNEIVLAVGDVFFSPRTITIPARETVTLQLINTGQAAHSFVIEELGIEVLLLPDQSKFVEINAPAGEYEFFSDIQGQRAAGMEGTLVAVPYGTPEADDFGVDCDTAIVIAASPEIEARPGTSVVIYAPVTTENSRLVEWEGTCED